MLQCSSFFAAEIFGNSVKAYLLAFIFFFAGLLILGVVQRVLLARLRKLAAGTASKTDDFAIEIFEKMLWPVFYVGVFYFAIQQLVLNAGVYKLITAFVLVVVTVQGTRFALAVLLFFLDRFFWKKDLSQGAALVSKSIITIIKVVVWGLAFVLLLDNLGFNVSAVVAGLGIGGVAVALAAQTILGDLFNYFVIFFDKPFEEGDFVIFGDYMGVIEHIGIKSTRIRSLGGEQIVVANSQLASDKIRNYKRMDKRRVLFKLGVTYETPREKLAKIPQMIRQIIEGIKGTAFDRAHFQGFGDFSLNYEIVYYVTGADYNQYMDIQQKINLAIMEAFEKDGIEFAYPTRKVLTVHQS